MKYTALLFGLVLAACGSTSSGDGDGGTSGCPDRCSSFGWQQCLSEGVYADPVPCTDDQICIPDLGCAVCIPGATYCDGPEDNEIWQCNDQGSGGEKVSACAGDEVCSQGICKTPCDRAADFPSTVGCEFWAVDLDNEAFSSTFGGFGSNDAAKEQYAVAVANNNTYAVQARVWANLGRVGEPLEEALVTEVTIAPNSLEQINLPQREVDGTMGQNGPYSMGSGSGTFVSPHGFRIETTGPVVAYQFNPIVQKFSNDASILIPIQALGDHYYVLGYPTANFCGSPPGDMFYQQSIPDYTSISIVGTADNTTVTVHPTHPIKASAGDSGIAIPRTDRGESLSFTINKYDVVNLESDQPQVGITQCLSYIDRDGDFSGSVVTSSKPVAVFSGLERGIGLGGAEPPDPPGWDGESCCTDHLEEQMFPTAALGWNFAISRSPVRSTNPSYKEPDIYRVLATQPGTEVVTSLPAPYDRFVLGAGEFKAFHSYGGFTIASNGGAIMVGQYLVSQGFIPDGGTGDPTFTIFPPAEQHRKEYVFLVPATFSKNYMVLVKPENAAVIVNGQGLGEFANCVSGDVGTINGIVYNQLTCEMPEGVHTVASDKPVGLTVYGYYNVGSYGYPGGSDVRIINPIE